MKLLLDEDSLAKDLLRLLRAQGHDVVTIIEADLAGSPDADVLDYATATGRVVVTRNGRDFSDLHAVNDRHHGILVQYFEADQSKTMTYLQVAHAILNIEASDWDIRGQFISVNAWQ